MTSKIKLLGLLTLVLCIIGLYVTTEYGFIFGVLSGLAIGWLITGKFIITSSK